MKIETAFLAIILILAATPAHAQSADGGSDDATDTADAIGDIDATIDAPTEVASSDGSGSSDASSPSDAGPSDASGVPDATSEGHSGGAQDAASSRLFARENPGCSLGGAPASGGWHSILASSIAFVAARRRRSSRAR